MCTTINKINLNNGAILLTPTSLVSDKCSADVAQIDCCCSGKFKKLDEYDLNKPKILNIDKFDHKNQRYSRYAQYVAAISANLSIITAGMMYGWPSPALRKVNLSSSAESWIASILMIGGVFGCIFASLVIDRIGRKWTIILSTLPNIVSWTLILFAEKHLYLLYVARFIGGLGVGSAYCALPMYIGEISDDAVRGAMGSLIDLSLSLGVLIEYVIGPYISFRLLAVISLIIPLINLLSGQFIPESPYFYCMRHSYEDARRSLQTLRGRNNVEKELLMLKNNVDLEMKERLGFRELFTQYGNRQAAIILLVLMTAMQFSGVGPLLSYSQDIFSKTGGNVDPRLSTIGVGVVQLVACCISMFGADSCGRRSLLLISSLGSALCLSATGAIFYTTEIMLINTKAIADISIATIMCYMILVNVGLSSQIYVLLSEMFPTNIKAVAVCFANLYMFLTEGLVTKVFIVFRTLADGYYLSFWIFALSTFLSFIFIIFYVPETKGKSLEEIQQWLNRKNPSYRQQQQQPQQSDNRE